MSVRRTNWKTLAILATVLGVGLIATWLLVGKMSERKPFVSKVTAGYRYRCTLSANWHLEDDAPEGSLAFTSSTNPIQEWIAVHLLHQPPSTGKVYNGKPELLMFTETPKNDIPSMIKMEGGYPEPDMSGSGGAGAKILSDKHLRIDGCPATIIKIEIHGGPKIVRVTLLLVCTPDGAASYGVESAAEPVYTDQADHEMQAVLASFHVEKVAAPTEGKR